MEPVQRHAAHIYGQAHLGAPDGHRDRRHCKSELSLRRQRASWNLKVDSITPQQKFEQYRQTNEYQMFGLGDGGQTVFAMSHDARAGENVEEYECD